MNNVSSPRPENDETHEAEIKRKGCDTAPRVTPEHIEAAIFGTNYIHLSYTTLTICVLTLRNGFTVVGESACADEANYDPEIGQRIARANAVQKVWALEGYLLKQRLHEEGMLRAEAPVP